ncbi:hypothetical protein Pcinc_037231 [Petrolisthes cinctipes]|uniref:Uncharacterized protein n=1 Tax=Petrolisthes cinctipes TaxID=88211 RepID=A0AAE1EP48_PETCI|nr:hypothetical protein Pcinc_037231 [Petrolisthes cinctipes]
MSGEKTSKTTAPGYLSPPPPPPPSTCDSSESGLDETSEPPSPRMSRAFDTEIDDQLVRRQKRGGEEEEVTVQSSSSGSIRLDYYTDKAVMQNYQKRIAKEVTDKESHKYSSKLVTSSHDRKHIPSVNGEETTPEVIEEISDSEADSNSTTAPDDSAVTHSFTFPLLSHKESEEVHRENESELQPAVGGPMSEGALPPDSTSVKSKTRTKKLSGSQVTNKDARDSDSSVSSRKKGSNKKAKIKSKFAPGSLEYIDERLRGRIFSGWVEERRWVEGINGYRDVIEVDEWEVEMNQQLKAIVACIPGVQEGTRWINITSPNRTTPNFCLWVFLDAPPRPGHYWFSVAAVKLQPQFGLQVVVKEIRQIHFHDGETAEKRQRRQMRRQGSSTSGEFEYVNEQVKDWLEQAQQLTLTSVWAAVSSTITFSNIRESIRFVMVLVMTLVLGLVMVVKESHHLGLRFIREAGIFFHNITPFMQTVLAFVEKIVGGMYLLVAMVYRDLRRPGRPSVPPPPPPHSPYPRALLPPTVHPATPNVSQQVKYVPPERWVFRTQDRDTPSS